VTSLVAGLASADAQHVATGDSPLRSERTVSPMGGTTWPQ
jgi:hypothetical protein